MEEKEFYVKKDASANGENRTKGCREEKESATQKNEAYPGGAKERSLRKEKGEPRQGFAVDHRSG